MTAPPIVALQHRVDLLAEDVGRLARRAEPGSYDHFLADRLAGHVESLDAMVQPTAHDLYLICGDVVAAIDEIDRRTAHLRSILYPRPRTGDE